LDLQKAARTLAEGALRLSGSEAWRVFSIAWPVLERFVRVRLLTARINPQLLEDCGQSVFTRVWNSRKTYRGSSEREFWAWLRRICDNERRRAQSKTARLKSWMRPLQTDCGAELTAVAPDETPAVDAAEREAIRALRDCLGRIDEKQRRVIELIYFRPQLSERAVAEILGCSPSQVHKIKVKAQQQLRACLLRRGIQ